MNSPKMENLITNANTPNDIKINFDIENEPFVTVFTNQNYYSVSTSRNKKQLQNFFKRKGF